MFFLFSEHVPGIVCDVQSQDITLFSDLVHFGTMWGTDADDGDDTEVPTTLPSGQTPRPSRPGTKYPVWG